ncbi:MAG: 5-formyltetrahydrofolate cyclo-ligase [Deltaproteobacteria bacterium]|nr:5-formyltetrahydrofolate cyclo-ligase [Deltaproteobacteria bacterium]
MRKQKHQHRSVISSACSPRPENPATKTSKAYLRTEARRRRDALSPQEIEVKSTASTDSILQIIESRRFYTVMLYLNMGSEVRTIPLMHKLLAADKIVLAPVMEPAVRKSHPYRIINPSTDIAPSKYGMLQPLRNRCQRFRPESIDLVAVPALAFDIKGYRIGYGGGYYDRFLQRCSQALWMGLAYEMQIIPDACPAEWDVPVHQIVTEERIINCYCFD